jgi:hypothetical protein
MARLFILYSLEHSLQARKQYGTYEYGHSNIILALNLNCIEIN